MFPFGVPDNMDPLMRGLIAQFEEFMNGADNEQPFDASGFDLLKNIRMNIRDELKHSMPFSLRLQLVTGCKGMKVLVIRAHYVSKYLVYLKFLGAKRLKEPFTSEAVRNAIAGTLSQFELSTDDIYSMNCCGNLFQENNGKSSDFTQLLVSPMDGHHAVELVVHEFLQQDGRKELMQQLSDIKKASPLDHLGDEFRMRDYYQCFVPSHLDVGPILSLINSVKRFNGAVGEKELAVDWKTLEAVLLSLGPMQRLLVNMKRKKYVAGDFLLGLSACERELDHIKIRNPTHSATLQEMKEFLATGVKQITSQVQFAAAVHMDNRIVHSEMTETFFTKEVLKAAQDYLMRLAARANFNEKPLTNQAMQSIREELLELPKRPNDATGSPLKYWRATCDYKSELPSLAQLALAYPVSYAPLHDLVRLSITGCNHGDDEFDDTNLLFQMNSAEYCK